MKKVLFVISLCIVFFGFFLIIFFFDYYVHESGHILFGFTDGLLRGHIDVFTIGNWIKHPLIQFILLPQQTKLIRGIPSLNFIFGGPLFNMLVFLGISLLGYVRSGKKAWFLLFVSICLFEISGNIICGTDNFYASPLSVCLPNLDLRVQYIAMSLFSGILTYMVLTNDAFKIIYRRLQ